MVEVGQDQLSWNFLKATDRVRHQWMRNRIPSAEFGSAVETGIDDGNVDRGKGRFCLRPFLPGINVRHI